MHFGLRDRQEHDDVETMMAAMNSPLFLIVQRTKTRGVKPRLATLKWLRPVRKDAPLLF